MVTNYSQAIQHLYDTLPVFHRIGAPAYKKDLSNTIALCKNLGNPQNKFKTIHVAGTNGKGSSSHMIAAVLQCAGYKTGLYTSPHLKEFTERIKINGKEADKDFVVEFVNRMEGAMAEIKPSFFELTVAMAFEYFSSNQVDIAVIETGLGGRLDSTNVITPEVSLITNIGYDHMDLLGNTLTEIASEKAGIIKPGVPVVISEFQPDVAAVFESGAKSKGSPLYFSTDHVKLHTSGSGHQIIFNIELPSHSDEFTLNPDLTGSYQRKNLCGVLQTISVLRELGYNIPTNSMVEGINHAAHLTGLKGRWQKLGDHPLIICDTAHNADGISEVVKQIESTKFGHLHWVFGMVKDKDAARILSQLPTKTKFYFCQAILPRAMNAEQLSHLAAGFNLHGVVVPDVNDALREAKKAAQPDDLIMVGGSTFVVAEVEGI